MCQDYYDEVLINLMLLPPHLRMEQNKFILNLKVVFSSSHATHHLHKKSAVIREKYEH